jgi:uncharacterized protein YrrD
MKDPLMRGSDLVGHPVVDLKTGEDLAEIRDVVFDSSGGDLSGFTLNKRGRWAGKLDAVLSIDHVSSVGTGAVMIDGVDAVTTSVDGTTELDAASEADQEVVDNLVVTESGRTLGSVRDVVIVGGSSPRVVAFEIDGGEVGGGFIPMSNQRGVSASALIVPDEYEGRLRNDLTGLADQIDELSEETS